MMESFGIIVNGWKPFTIVAKLFILDIYGGRWNASELCNQQKQLSRGVLKKTILKILKSYQENRVFFSRVLDLLPTSLLKKDFFGVISMVISMVISIFRNNCLAQQLKAHVSEWIVENVNLAHSVVWSQFSE